MTQPILVHVHIPKCAGQWFEKVLWRMYGPRERWASIIPSGFGPVLGLEDQKYRGNISEFERTLRGKPWARAITSQKFVGDFPRVLAGRDARYVTILRDPNEQAISFLRYVVKKYDNFPEWFRSKLPTGMQGAGLLDAAGMVFNEKPGLMKHILAVQHFAPETRDESEAIARLESLDFVGTTVATEALAMRVARWAAPDRDPAAVMPPARVNVSSDGSDEEEAEAVRALPSFQAYLRSKSVAVSRALFERARDIERCVNAQNGVDSAIESAEASGPAGVP